MIVRDLKTGEERKVTPTEAKKLLEAKAAVPVAKQIRKQVIASQIETR
jgi:hypothetical protein